MIGLLSLAVLTLDADAASPACKGCNIVWIVLDSNRADALSPYGAQVSASPNIDRLAKRGAVYEQAYAQGSETIISVASYFTSRHRRRTGVDFTMSTRGEALRPLAPEFTTVAEALAAAGYKTAGYTANPVIAGEVQLDLKVYQGFQTWKRVEDSDMARLGGAFMEQSKGAPFLLYLHYMGAHYPNAPLPGLEGRQGKVDTSLATDPEPVYFKIKTGKVVPTEAQSKGLRAVYADAVWEVDSRVGEVLQKIDAMGLKDRTLIIITADHGESLGENLNPKGYADWGHGHDLSPELVQVPLIVAGPGIPAGRVGDRLAELVDLGPSILQHVGVAEDPAWGWDGDPLWGPGAVVGTTAISDRGNKGASTTLVRDRNLGVDWNEKTQRAGYLSYPGGLRSTRLGAAQPAHSGLKATLDAYLQASGPAGPATPVQDIDQSTEDALKALGYRE
jgi:arylsulfatase A-like enzyme